MSRIDSERGLKKRYPVNGRIIKMGLFTRCGVEASRGPYSTRNHTVVNCCCADRGVVEASPGCEFSFRVSELKPPLFDFSLAFLSSGALDKVRRRKRSGGATGEVLALCCS